MPEAVTQSQFYEAMRQLEDKIQAYHRSSRENIDQQCERILVAFRKHEDDDRIVANDVLTIKTERAIEKQQAKRYGAISGTVAASLIIALVEALRKLLSAGH